ISTIVPMVSYPDHNPHSVDIIITDQGIADLRGKDPVQSAHEIIEHAAHPVYRPMLREYLSLAKKGHVMMNPDIAFAMHSALMHEGDMRKVDFAKFMK
ncbi:MAG: acetyl-CoA hydrolase, partial [Muribaculaceae bacterium]|nr:acetyl-CoA hydrolase [Muribaculaceae bacterium]